MLGLPVHKDAATYPIVLLDRIAQTSHVLLLGALSVVALITAALWPMVSHDGLLTWGLLMLLLQAAQAGYSQRYLKQRSPKAGEYARWKAGFMLLTILTGLEWGSSFFFLGVSGSDPAATFLIICIAGATAFMAIARSSIMSLALAFEASALLPTAGWMFIQGDHIHVFMAVVVLLYLGMLVLLLYKMNAMTQWHQRLNFENLQLLENQKQDAALLSLREREFFSLAENLPDNIARWDTEGRYFYINPTHERLLGMRLDEVLGKPLPDSHQQVMAAIAQVASTGKEIIAVRQEVQVNGQLELHDVRLVPEFNEAGQVASVLGLGRDMTAHYKMQEALAEREQAFRSLAESSPDSIIRYDREQRILYLNEVLIKDLQLVDADEVIGKRPGEVWPDGRFTAIEKAAKRAVASGKKESVELVWEREPGETVIGHILVVPEYESAGNIIGTLAFGREITSIRETEQRLAQFISNFPGLAFTFCISPEGQSRLLFASADIEDFYGLKPEDVHEDMDLLLMQTHPDDKPRIRALIAASEWDMQPFSAEMRICRPNIPERWVELRATPQPQSQLHGSIVWHGLMIDISERKQLEEALATREQEFRNLAENSPDTIIRYDRHCRRLYVNSAVCCLAGKSVEALLGSTPDAGQVVVSEQAQTLMEGIRQVLDTGEVMHLYLDVVASNGELLNFQVMLVPEFDTDGQVTTVLSLGHDITPIKKAEHQLREQSDFQQTLLDATSEVGLQIMVVENGRITYVGNRTLAHELGYSDEEIDSHPPLLDIIHPDDRQRVMEYHKQRLAGEAVPNSYEVGLVTRTGERIEYETSAAIVPGSYPIRVITVGKDITERKRIQEMLQKSHEALEEAQRIGHIGSWDVDIVNDVLTWSDETFRIWEINKEGFEATFEAFLHTVHPDDRELVVQAYNGSISNHTLYEVEHRLLFSDGRIKHILERGEPYFDADGKPVRFVGTSLDITERKLAEQRLLQAQAFTESIINAIPDPLFVKDSQHRWMFLNDTFCSFLGHSREAMLGKSDYDFLPKEEADVFWQKDEAVFASGEVDLNEESITDAQGITHFIQTKKTPCEAKDGKHYLVGIIRDITERKRMEERLIESQARLLSIMQTMPDMVWMKNLEGVYLSCNHAFEELVGKVEQEVIGCTDY